MTINIETASAWAKTEFEAILATQPTSQQMAWYSAIEGTQFDDTKKVQWVIHPTYPSIYVLIGPMDVTYDFDSGYTNQFGPATHLGSTLLNYLTSSDLEPSGSGAQDYRMKPKDKLVDSDGAIYYITMAVPSTARVKTVIAVRREDTRDTVEE